MWSSANRKLRVHDLFWLKLLMLGKCAECCATFVLLNVLVSVVEDVVIEDDVEVVRVTS